MLKHALFFPELLRACDKLWSQFQRLLRPQCCVYILSEASLHGRNLYPKHLNVTCLHRNDRTSRRKKLPLASPAAGRGAPVPSSGPGPAAVLLAAAQLRSSTELWLYDFHSLPLTDTPSEYHYIPENASNARTGCAPRKREEFGRASLSLGLLCSFLMTWDYPHFTH